MDTDFSFQKGIKNYIMNEQMVRWAWEKKQMGYSFADIARALYVHPQTIRNNFIKFGLQTGRANTILPPLHYDGEFGFKEDADD